MSVPSYESCCHRALVASFASVLERWASVCERPVILSHWARSTPLLLPHMLWFSLSGLFSEFCSPVYDTEGGIMRMRTAGTSVVVMFFLWSLINSSYI